MLAPIQTIFGASRPQACPTRAVGDTELTYEVFDISTDKDLRLIVYTTQAGSASKDALELLTSWTATQAQTGEDLSTRP